MQTRLLFVHTLSPLHAGTGQSVGAVDLPIARSRATDHPYLPGSSLKGSLRDRARQLAPKDVIAVFGPETDNASDHAGAVAFGDANLLLLPVRSVAGTFAWVTSPLLLAAFQRDAAEAGLAVPRVPMPKSLTDCHVSPEYSLKVSLDKKDRVVFEDLDLTPFLDADVLELTKKLGSWLFPEDKVWQQLLKERLCVVHDDVLSFLARHGTDVVTRVQLDESSKTVKGSALWTEENLPPETVLVSSLLTMPNPKSGIDDERILTVIQDLTGGMVQFGGKATVGRGRCRLVLAGGAA